MKCWEFALGIALAGSAIALDGSERNPNGIGCALAVPVRVLTPKLKVVDGLQEADFSLTEDRVQQKICGFAHVRQAASTGVLLDGSGSMRAVAQYAAAAIERLFDTSGPQDEYFLESVDAASSMKCQFSRDTDSMRSALQARPSGPTTIVDSILVALEAMRKAHHPNRALIIISDAEDNKSTRRPGDIARVLAASPVPMFLVVPVDRPEPELVFSRKDLVGLAKWSGGYAMQANRDEILQAVVDIADAIRRPYWFYLGGPPTAGVKQSRELRMEVKGVRPRPLLLFREVIRYTE